MKVRIKKLPQARTGYQVRGGLVNDVPSMGGADYNAYIGQPNPSVKKTMTAVPREEANLEAEKGETAVTDLNGDGIPEHYKIGGKRHYDGGTPLYLPDNSFIFSRDRKMKIKDPEILKQFGMAANKGGYTPADVAKKYDINKFRQILGDKDTDDLQRKSAEAMIASYNMKLGKLALVQEAIKGFPQGIPAIAMPYIEASGIDPASFIKAEPQESEEETVPEDMTEAQPEQEGEESVARYGANIVSQMSSRKMGGGTRRVKVTFPKYQTGGAKTAAAPATAKALSTGVKYETTKDLYEDPEWQENVKSGNAYIKGPNGKYYRANYVSPQPPKEAFDESLGNFKDEYAYPSLP